MSINFELGRRRRNLSSWDTMEFSGNQDDLKPNLYIYTISFTMNSVTLSHAQARNNILGQMWILCKVLIKNKRTILFLLVVLEIISVALEASGKGRWGFLLASFVIAAVGFTITICGAYSMNERPTSDRSGNRLIIVEVVFSAVQFMLTGIYFLLTTLGVKISINASIFPLVFSILVFFFTFFEEGSTPTSTTTTSIDNSEADTNPSFNIVVPSPNDQSRFHRESAANSTPNAETIFDHEDVTEILTQPPSPPPVAPPPHRSLIQLELRRYNTM
ncbi:hypothetical protein ACOSP7_003928 [Xanthoceras sorbifolium]